MFTRWLEHDKRTDITLWSQLQFWGVEIWFNFQLPSHGTRMWHMIRVIITRTYGRRENCLYSRTATNSNLLHNFLWIVVAIQLCLFIYYFSKKRIPLSWEDQLLNFPEEVKTVIPKGPVPSPQPKVTYLINSFIGPITWFSCWGATHVVCLGQK